MKKFSTMLILSLTLIVLSSTTSLAAFTWVGTIDLSGYDTHYTNTFSRNSSSGSVAYFSFSPKNGAQSGSVTIYLQRYVNGNWQTVDYNSYYISSYDNSTNTAAYYDSMGDAGDLYRFKVSNNRSTTMKLTFCTINY